MPKIIQNAIQLLRKSGKHEYIKSAHVHDFQEGALEDGSWIACDGSTDYIRRAGNLEATHLYEDFSLYETTPFEIIKQKLLWGVLINNKTTHKPLIELETNHLLNIVKDYGNMLSEIYLKVINSIISDRQSAENNEDKY